MKSFHLIVLAGLAGCASPLHLQYDYGRAYTAARDTQADLRRASVSDSAYTLSGVEGLELRSRVTEESTDAEKGQAQYVDKFTVQ